MVDTSLLMKEIEDIGIKKKTLAEKCHMSRNSLDNKLRKPKTITADDFMNFAEALRIEYGTEKFRSIFLAPEVEENVH